MEEIGIPVPLLSGDVLLIVAGVLIVQGSISPWVFFPAAFAAEVPGVMLAHLWSRTIGQKGLKALADRMRARKALDRASARLGTAGPLHITVSRLVPGLRINTSLVAGAAGVSPGTFLLGVIPAIVIWLAGYTLLGVLVGVPALAFLNHVQHVAVTGGALALIGLITVIAIRRVPPARNLGHTVIWVSRPLVAALAVAIDMLIAGVFSGTTELVPDWLGFDGPDGVLSLAVIVAVVVLLYVGAARGVMGGTAGERLTGVRYSFA